ncbi:hypothetical protein ELOC111193_17685 [Elizabethkingia occulta]|uniref:Deaminase n=2 Tax=Elizabethkingia TaxID=308865 RepID=A0A1T3MNN8_9FLAO|nr:hypothetical protein [Elizabethkingia occulta]OPC65931.1 hypothetical protein BAZ10_01465 [Elizabethkingia occulta]
MEDLCAVKRTRIVETTSDPDLTSGSFYFLVDANYERVKNTINNAFWFLEGEDANLMLFHFFSDYKAEKVDYVVCNLGSDIFDCIKLNTNVFPSGGYVIESNGKKTINPELNEFKKSVTEQVLAMYRQSPKLKNYRLEPSQISKAIDMEFYAEATYQKAVDWIFDKIGVTTTFKYLVGILKDNAKFIGSYKFQEYNYLPYLSNFDPFINDSFLKAFGINPTVLIERYSVSKEQLKYYNIKEKEVNLVYAFNAEFCGFWNALIDSIEGLYLTFPGIYEIFTDRANLKKFIRMIINIFENFTELKDIIVRYDHENSQGSIYKFCYQQAYEITMLLSLLLPLPKAPQGLKSSSVFEFFSNALAKISAKSELLLLAYKLGLRVERTADEWVLISDKVVLFRGTKEKVLKRIEHIAEVAEKNPKFVMRLLSPRRLEALIDVKKGKGAFLKGLSKESKLIVQKKLEGANIAVAKFKVSYKGRVKTIELKAYSSSNVKELNNLGFAKPANLRSGEKITQFEEITEKGVTRRFQDTESKIFREFEDLHLKETMNQLGAKSANDLKIEVELQTILDPCNICQGQMTVFEAKYNTKIDIYSSGAKDGEKLYELYPNFKIKKQ